MEDKPKPQGDAPQKGELNASGPAKPTEAGDSPPPKGETKSKDSGAALQKSPVRPAQGKNQGKPGAPSAAPVFLGGAALVIALVALGGAVWLYQQNTELTVRLGDVSRGAQARYEELGSHTAIKGLDERTRLLAERVAERFARIDASLQRTDEALRGAAREEISDTRGLQLAELDYVLRIAAHRLLLLQDVDGAIAALQTADRQLHKMGSPVFIPLRERLDADMRALRAVQRPDIPGVAIKIDGLIDVIHTLPPRTLTTGIQTASADTGAAVDEIWQTLQRFVVIKHNEQPLRAPPIRYAPENHARTLAASLNAAQNAALRADTGEYRRQLENVADSLRQNFDPESQLVLETLREVETLAGVSLTAELPDITGSFALLDELRARSDESEEKAP